MRSAYLDARGEPFLAFLHEAPSGAGASTAVLLLPPLGWDETASYRPRRDWAVALAAAGHPTARIDLPGTADSAGGPQDPDRLEAWTEAVAVAAAWLRAETGARRLAVVAPGPAGFLALRAGVAEDLVLWGVPARGRAYVRQVEAFAQMEAPQLGVPGGAPEGAVAAGGHLLSASTLAALRAVDLREVETAAQRALVLGRDGTPPDKALVERLRGQGVEVTTGGGRGWGAMHVEPHNAVVPDETVAEVGAWLAAAPDAGSAPPPAPPSRATMERYGWRERPVSVAGPDGALFAIATEPVAAPATLTAVWLNAGAIPRRGPNRLWAEAARRWAGQGVASLRLDVQGVGDAEGEPVPDADVSFYVPEYVEQVRAALDAAGAAGLPAPYVLVGLCSGAYFALHAALEDDRAAAALLLNPRLLVWDPETVERRAQRRARRRPKLRAWRRVLRGQIGPRWILARVRELRGAPRLAGVPAAEQDLDGALAAIERSSARFVLAFSAEEPLEAELAADGTLDRLRALPNVDVVRLPGRDHTLRSLTAQRAAHEAIDEVVARVRHPVTG